MDVGVESKTSKWVKTAKGIEGEREDNQESQNASKDETESHCGMDRATLRGSTQKGTLVLLTCQHANQRVSPQIISPTHSRMAPTKSKAD